MDRFDVARRPKDDRHPSDDEGQPAGMQVVIELGATVHQNAQQYFEAAEAEKQDKGSGSGARRDRTAEACSEKRRSKSKRKLSRLKKQANVV